MSSTRGVIVRYMASDDDLAPAPIDPAWIVEGTPQARARALSFAADGTIDASLWACSAGRFNWHYDRDEAIHILDGEAEVTSPDGVATTIRPGDIVYFSGGQVVPWHVPEHVTKVAFRSRHASLPRRVFKRLPLARRAVHMLRAHRARSAMRRRT